MVAWNKSTTISALLSDVYFTMGNVAAAQEMAFESNIGALCDGNPRMTQRLVQTNLIYGAYPVAEKYIAVLENTSIIRIGPKRSGNSCIMMRRSRQILYWGICAGTC